MKLLGRWELKMSRKLRRTGFIGFRRLRLRGFSGEKAEDHDRERAKYEMLSRRGVINKFPRVLLYFLVNITNRGKQKNPILFVC